MGLVLAIDIDKDLVGQFLQFGFLNTASNYEASGIFYDNVNFDMAASSVVLDIRPGSCPNPINGSSRGVLPVAILGTDGFDVSNIDVSTLRLEGVAPLRWNYSDSGDSDYICGCEGQLAGIATSEGTDASGMDERDDLNLKFSTQDILAMIGSPAHGEKVVLTLTGSLLDGTPIEAQDCVVGVGGGGPDRPVKAGALTGR